MPVLELLKELISFKSITPKDDGALNFLALRCAEFEPFFINKGEVKNLILTKEYGPGPHLAFCSHVDVVPAGPGWSFDPFKANELDGFLYGRGTQDMKGAIAAFIMAAKDAKDFSGKLSILITSDEEGPSIHGTKEILAFMQESNNLPDFAIVGEPTCTNSLGDGLKIGRRGSINAELIIKGVQGHSAYPEKCTNPIHQVADLLKALAGFDLDPGSNEFAPSKIVITNINAGLGVDNVTPSSLSLRLNVRNSIQTSQTDVRSYIESLCKGLDFELISTQSSLPYLSDSNSLVLKKLVSSIVKITGKSPELNTKGGTSDAKHIAAYKIPVVEFGLKNDRIHAIDERVAIDDLVKLYEIYKDFLENFNKKAKES